MAKEVMAKSIMVNDMKYIDSVGIPGGEKIPDDVQNKPHSSGLTLGIVITICVILGIVSGIFFAKRGANK